MQVYGADEVWRQLTREGVVVARCTVERLMRTLGLRGVVRGKVVRTTIGDTKAPCPLDRVNRQLRAERHKQLWVSDFTYVSSWQGWLQRGLRHRRLCQAHRGLAGEQHNAHRLRVRCTGASRVRPTA